MALTLGKKFNSKMKISPQRKANQTQGVRDESVPTNARNSENTRPREGDLELEELSNEN